MALQATHTTCNPTQPATDPRTSGESGPAACTELLPARLPVDLLRRASRRDAARTIPLPTRAAARRGLSNLRNSPQPSPSLLPSTLLELEPEPEPEPEPEAES